MLAIIIIIILTPENFEPKAVFWWRNKDHPLAPAACINGQRIPCLSKLRLATIRGHASMKNMLAYFSWRPEQNCQISLAFYKTEVVFSNVTFHSQLFSQLPLFDGIWLPHRSYQIKQNCPQNWTVSQNEQLKSKGTFYNWEQGYGQPFPSWVTGWNSSCRCPGRKAVAMVSEAEIEKKYFDEEMEKIRSHPCFSQYIFLEGQQQVNRK